VLQIDTNSQLRLDNNNMRTSEDDDKTDGLGDHISNAITQRELLSVYVGDGYIALFPFVTFNNPGTGAISKEFLQPADQI
jgi:hypothetical protein